MADQIENTQNRDDDVVAVLENQETEDLTLFRVIVKNSCAYPGRIVTFVDERTGHCEYAAFRTYEERELLINMRTFQRLQQDPKVRMKRVEN